MLFYPSTICDPSTMFNLRQGLRGGLICRQSKRARRATGTRRGCEWFVRWDSLFAKIERREVDKAQSTVYEGLSEGKDPSNDRQRNEDSACFVATSDDMAGWLAGWLGGASLVRPIHHIFITGPTCHVKALNYTILEP